MKEPLLRLTQLWRAYGAKAANGQYRVGNINASFGQGPLQAPSVFNFFSPFYAPPGEIADQGLVAPELQIATEYLNTTVTNINTILVTISIAVVTIAIIWAGFKMIFQGARLADVANVLIGGTLVGGAAAFASYIVS